MYTMIYYAIEKNPSHIICCYMYETREYHVE